MSDRANEARHGVGYTGAVLLRQLDRLLTEAEKLGDAKNDFLDALSADSHDRQRYLEATAPKQPGRAERIGRQQEKGGDQ